MRKLINATMPNAWGPHSCITMNGVHPAELGLAAQHLQERQDVLPHEPQHAGPTVPHRQPGRSNALQEWRLRLAPRGTLLLGHGHGQADQLGQALRQRLRANLDPLLITQAEALEQERHQAAVPAPETGGVKRQRRYAPARQFLLHRSQPGLGGLRPPIPRQPDKQHPVGVSADGQIGPGGCVAHRNVRLAGYLEPEGDIRPDGPAADGPTPDIRNADRQSTGPSRACPGNPAPAEGGFHRDDPCRCRSSGRHTAPCRLK